MELAAKLDDYGKPAWIAVTVLALIVFWPLGLAILAYLFWSGRMGCWRRGGPGRWHHTERARKRSETWFGREGRNGVQRQHGLRRVPRGDAAPP